MALALEQVFFSRFFLIYFEKEFWKESFLFYTLSKSQKNYLYLSHKVWNRNYVHTLKIYMIFSTILCLICQDREISLAFHWWCLVFCFFSSSIHWLLTALASSSSAFIDLCECGDHQSEKNARLRLRLQLQRQQQQQLQTATNTTATATAAATTTAITI